MNRPYNLLKIFVVASITLFCIGITSCEDDAEYEPPANSTPGECEGSYCKLDKGGKEEVDLITLLVNSKNPETF